jgi:hypothetical protein
VFPTPVTLFAPSFVSSAEVIGSVPGTWVLGGGSVTPALVAGALGVPVTSITRFTVTAARSLNSQLGMCMCFLHWVHLLAPTASGNASNAMCMPVLRSPRTGAI